MNITRPLLPLSLFCLLCLAACPKPGEGGGEESARPASSQTVTVRGSDTLVLLAQRLAEAYMEKKPGTSIQVTGGGTGTGIAALINGSTQIATASRPITSAEKAQIQQRSGAPAVITEVAQDGIAVYVHQNNPVESLTINQIRDIYTGEIRDWSEVGGPPGRISLYSRENNSGTYAFFKEVVLENEDFLAETQTLPGTAAVVHGISRDPTGIGYGGIAYDTGVKAIAVQAGEGKAPVKPTLESVASGSYPISRHLYMITAGEPEGTVADFLAFARSAEGQAIAAQAGYFPLPKAQEEE